MLGAFFAGMGAALILWIMSTGVVALAIFAILFGTCYGGVVAVSPAVAMDYFGVRSVAGIIGVAYTGPGIGVGIGPWLAGVSYDINGSYTLPIVASTICMLLAAVTAVLLARQPTLPD